MPLLIALLFMSLVVGNMAAERGGCSMQWDAESVLARCRLPFVGAPHAYAIDLMPVPLDNLRGAGTACGSRASTSHQEATSDQYWSIPMEWAYKLGRDMRHLGSVGGVAYPTGPGFWSCDEPRGGQVTCEGRWPLDLWLSCVGAGSSNRVDATIYVSMFLYGDKETHQSVTYSYPSVVSVGSTWRVSRQSFIGAGCARLFPTKSVTLTASGPSQVALQFNTQVIPCGDYDAGYLTPSADVSASVTVPTSEQAWKTEVDITTTRPFTWNQVFVLWLCKNGLMGACYAEMDQVKLSVGLSPNVVVITGQGELSKPSIQVGYTPAVWSAGVPVSITLNATQTHHLYRLPEHSLGPSVESIRVTKMTVKQTGGRNTPKTWDLISGSHPSPSTFSASVSHPDGNTNVLIQVNVPQLSGVTSEYEADLEVHWEADGKSGKENRTIAFSQGGCDLDQMFQSERLICMAQRTSTVMYVVVCASVAVVLYAALATMRWVDQKKATMRLQPDLSHKVKNYV